MAYGKSIELSTIGINNDHLVRDKFNINILDSCEILWAVDWVSMLRKNSVFVKENRGIDRHRAGVKLNDKTL